MDFKQKLTGALGQIKRGLDALGNARQSAYQQRLDILARFEKRASWECDSWAYREFRTAPEERKQLDAQNLPKREITGRCDARIATDAATKTPFICQFETGPAEAIADRVRALVDAGENPDAVTFLKETPLGYTYLTR